MSEGNAIDALFRGMFDAKASRLAELLQAIYRSSKREIHLAPKNS